MLVPEKATDLVAGKIQESMLQGASLASDPPSVAFARFARSITGRDELARFNYSECGLRSLRSLTHMGVMSSLASATPSVAYARFARSLTGA